MENRKIPALIAVVGVVVAVALFFVLQDNTADQDTELDDPGNEQAGAPADDEPAGGGNQGSGGNQGGPDEPSEPKKPDAPTIEIKGGQPVKGLQGLEFTEGEAIRFTVVSDEAWEIHMHGYDVTMDVPAGGEAKFDVPADIGGVFEVEIEDTAVPIAEISVVP